MKRTVYGQFRDVREERLAAGHPVRRVVEGPWISGRPMEVEEGASPEERAVIEAARLFLAQRMDGGVHTIDKLRDAVAALDGPKWRVSGRCDEGALVRIDGRGTMAFVDVFETYGGLANQICMLMNEHGV